jgi:hypothetical protein
MFSMLQRKPHADRKRIVARFYSKTVLISSPEIEQISQEIVMERLLSILDEAAKNQTPIDILLVFLAAAMDFICAYLFGLQHGSNFLEDTETRERWQKAHYDMKGYGFWPTEFPGVTSFLSKIGISVVPAKAISAKDEVRSVCLNILNKMETSRSQKTNNTDEEKDSSIRNRGVIYDQLLRHLGPKLDSGNSVTWADLSPQAKLDVASELMDHIMAGTETSGWSLTYIIHELSQRPGLQTLLRSELARVSPPLSYPQPVQTPKEIAATLPSAREIDAQPLLEAIILESLRLHPAVNGIQPRLTPATPLSLCGYEGVPFGIRVGAQAYSLHRNPTVFPDPEAWRPERWLQASQAEKHDMMSWFWPFGSGRAMCIGNHFAMIGKHPFQI